MKRLCLLVLAIPVIAMVLAPLAGQTPAAPSQTSDSQKTPDQVKTPDPPDATGWFVRAYDRSDLRVPGAAPFHIRAVFHAGPGMDFAKPGQSTIVTGDGVYEETWISPTQWRREVALGSYHAVEVRGSGGRKFKASSDYEPSRVLMFLDALYNPVPRNLVSPELIDKHAGWKIEHRRTGRLQYIRISSFTPINADTELKHEYDFLPSGMLIQNAESDSVSTSWQDYVPFAGRIVPRRLRVFAMGNALIEARVSVEPIVSERPAALFELPGATALPGDTLRPLHPWDVHYGTRVKTDAFRAVGDAFEGSVGGVIDRSGVPRELEVIAAKNVGQADVTLAHYAAERYAPSTIDGNPCQVILRMQPGDHPNMGGGGRRGGGGGGRWAR